MLINIKTIVNSSIKLPGSHTINTTVRMYILPVKQSPSINETMQFYN
jgi:hypothetical protein